MTNISHDLRNDSSLISISDLKLILDLSSDLYT